MATVAVLVASLLLADWRSSDWWRRFEEKPCLLRNNYLLMEITRPVHDCDACRETRAPLVFERPPGADAFDAFSTQPALFKGAAAHWPAMEYFSVEFFRALLDGVDGAYQSVEDECQFLPFLTEFSTLREALHMDARRSREPWYIGWSNCHPEVSRVLRSHYVRPEFLPADGESSVIDWIFMGSPGPATTMHLDYVLRPSWQAQIRGKKLWTLKPPPECESICHDVNITVESGDIVLIDTTAWYHATQVLPEGGLSIAIGCGYD